MPTGLYKRGDIWWARIQLAGREYRRSLRTGNRVEAQKYLEAWRAKLTASIHFGIEQHTWQEACLRYTAEVLPGAVKASTGKRYLVSFRQVNDVLNGLDVRAIGRKELAQIAGRGGPTNATKRRDLTAVLSVLRACESWHWIDEAPSSLPARRLIRERRDPIRLPADDEVARLEAACPPMLAALVRVLVSTGMRLQEAGTLEWRHVDLARGVVTLEQTKTDSPRAIEVGTVVGTLRALPRRLDVPWVFWHGMAGRRYLNLSSRLREIGQRCKPPIPWRIHDLRHKHAVDALRGGMSIYAIQQRLGHKSIKATEIYLAYLTPTEQQQAMQLGA